ncbi:heme-binding protein soul2 [Mugil cephalus]|uniref:heme-binding protein soul2 n=1 Tax=Mugil cephalus TaxID=48193 RepID=UPI001FB5C427|nr:heme-binding protein soul2 [Mugil cephalus]
MDVLLKLLALLLVSLHRGHAWTPPDFCHGHQCPQYSVVETRQDFEERSYVATDWITTKVDGTGTGDVIAANSKLKDYCQRQKDAGYEISVDTSPTLITVTKGEGDDVDFTMSWFVPPGTRKPEIPDPFVSWESKPEATVYVRVFGGTPSLESGEENAKLLREALDKAGKSLDGHAYSGASYDSYFSLTHHNEIWIYAAA